MDNIYRTLCFCVYNLFGDEGCIDRHSKEFKKPYFAVASLSNLVHLQKWTDTAVCFNNLIPTGFSILIEYSAMIVKISYEY